MTASLVVSVLVGPAQWASGGDLSDEPFGLRLGLALDRGSAFSDVVAIGAQTAYPYLSSVNPGAADFLREPPANFTILGSGTGALVAFEGGPTITGGALTLSGRLPTAGTILLGYSRIDSHDAVSHQRDGYVLRSNEIRLSYGHRVMPEVSLGAMVRLSESTLSFTSTEADFPLRTQTDTLGVEGSIGVLAQPAEHWLVGLVVATGWQRSRTKGSIDFPPPPFAPGLVPIVFSDNSRSLNVRVGGAWRPSEKVGVYADGQYLRLENDRDNVPGETAEVGRGWIGVEYMPIRMLALRVGGSVDTERQLTAGAGIGFYPSKYFQLDAAYSYNALPELRKEFGRAHLFSVSMTSAF